MSLLGNVGGVEGEEISGGEGLILNGGKEGSEVGGGKGWEDAAEVRHGGWAGDGGGRVKLSPPHGSHGWEVVVILSRNNECREIEESLVYSWSTLKQM